MEDWIVHIEPTDTTEFKLEKRISFRLYTALKEAYSPLDGRKIEESLIVVCALLLEQIVDLHRSFSLDRVLEKDLAAVKLILNQQIAAD